MNKRWFSILPLLQFSIAASAGQFVIELYEPLEQIDPQYLSAHSVEIEHTFAAGEDSYAVLSASNSETLSSVLKSAEIEVEKITEVLYVNTPMLGGGESAGQELRTGHQVFIIERPIPGVGFFGLDKKEKISKSSNNAIAKLGEIIEWDRSYLTSEGTYCVYRADSSETLREHGALAGAPIGKITAVKHQNFD